MKPQQKLSDLILHPVRLRLLQSLAGRQLTAAQLGETLSDVPQATLYRHLKALLQGDVLEIVAERPVRGTVERVYALREGGGYLNKADFAVMDREEHLRCFRVFTALLLDAYVRYLQQPGAQPADDCVGYSTGLYELSDAELEELQTGMRASVADFANRKNVPGRRRRLLSFIVMPATDIVPDQAPDEDP